MTKSKIYNYSKEQLQEMLNTYPTYIKILENIGIYSASSTQTLKRIIGEYELDTSIFEANHKKYISEKAKEANSQIYRLDEKLVNGKKVNSHKLKNKLIEAGLKECKCEICGISEWLGKEIKLHLHHIDGNHFNNELSNIMLLCPNCHSYTDNYGVYNSTRYKGNKDVVDLRAS